jgi:hypothetical protein
MNPVLSFWGRNVKNLLADLKRLGHVIEENSRVPAEGAPQERADLFLDLLEAAGYDPEKEEPALVAAKDHEEYVVLAAGNVRTQLKSLFGKLEADVRRYSSEGVKLAGRVTAADFGDEGQGWWIVSDGPERSMTSRVLADPERLPAGHPLRTVEKEKLYLFDDMRLLVLGRVRMNAFAGRWMPRPWYDFGRVFYWTDLYASRQRKTEEEAKREADNRREQAEAERLQKFAKTSKVEALEAKVAELEALVASKK